MSLPQAPAFIRKWERVMAVGCSHGHHIHPGIAQQVIDFRRAFNPSRRYHLGDIVDTAAFRSGAKGTKDETEDPRPDVNSGIDFVRQYEPDRITWGNHDVRLLELSTHPSGIVSYAASDLWNKLTALADELRAETRPYHFRKGWFEEGGYHWGHGYWYPQNAVRDHAEFNGGPTVMAHVHAPEKVYGRTKDMTPSFCVGLIADVEKLTYAHRRRATSRWNNALVFGEMCEDESRLFLAESPQPGEPIIFPPGVM